jgi:hypothetical protein
MMDSTSWSSGITAGSERMGFSDVVVVVMVVVVVIVVL